MHDPSAVAWEIPSPIPHRKKWAEKHYRGRRWGFTRRRGTGEQNRGKPVYRWWRPAGWTFAVAGRVYGLGRLATIWHVEPGGRDSGEVCRHFLTVEQKLSTPRWRIRCSPFLSWHPSEQGGYVTNRAWRWHVWHWRIQVGWLQSWRARLFDRCEECGRKGRPNFSHQWDGPRLGWWKFQSRRGLYHRECSSLVHMRRQQGCDERLIRALFAAYRVAGDMGEVEALALLTDPSKRSMEFGDARRLTKIVGYDRDEGYRLIKAQEGDDG